MFKKAWSYSSTGSPRLVVGFSTNLYLYWLLLGHDVLNYAVLQLTHNNIQLITGTLPYLFWNSIKKQKQNTFDLQLLYQNQYIMQIHNSGHHNSKGSNRFKFCIMYKITPFAFKKFK